MKVTVKRYLIGTFVLLFVMVGGIIFFRPLPILPPNSDVAISQVSYRTNTVIFSDFDIDINEMLDILNRYYTRRTFINPLRRGGSRKYEIWRISIMHAIMPIRISISENIGVVYFSESDFVVRRIINPIPLSEELRGMMFIE